MLKNTVEIHTPEERMYIYIHTGGAYVYIPEERMYIYPRSVFIYTRGAYVGGVELGSIDKEEQ